MGLIIKNGVIYNGAESEPVIYSLDEREVGVWTDGKPLYKRTLAYAKSDISSGDNTITHGISNFGISVWLEGFVIYIDGNGVTLPAVGANNDWSARAYDFGTTTFALTIGSGMYNNLTTSGYAIFITVYYTKTTDTPGSGTWTPSGVKAEHYLTTEHVIGTWLDGSTVYERSIDLGSFSVSSGGNHTVESSTDINLLIDYDGYIVESGTMYALPDPSVRIKVDSSKNLIFTGTASWYVSSGYLTIRYTKSSS